MFMSICTVEGENEGKGTNQQGLSNECCQPVAELAPEIHGEMISISGSASRSANCVH